MSRILFIFFLFIGKLSLAQTTICLKKDTIHGYDISSPTGIHWSSDENQSHIYFTSKQTKGLYNVFFEDYLIARINYISRNEYLIYEYEYHDSSKIKSINYYPYFELSITDNDSTKSIKSVRAYKDNIEIETSLFKNCDIRLLLYSTPFRKFKDIYIHNLKIGDKWDPYDD